MSIRAPHFLLMAESNSEEDQNEWRFVLASSDGEQKLVASDTEEAIQGERLELLSVVRGLEALEQPSEVTLLTDSRYVSQGISHGLSEWRSNDWCWERFGEFAPVKNRDLWQRIDRALRYHRVDCRTWRFDFPHTPAGPMCPPVEQEDEQENKTARAKRRPRQRMVAFQSKPLESAENQPSRRSERYESARPARGMFAACQRWVQQASDSWQGLQSKFSWDAP